MKANKTANTAVFPNKQYNIIYADPPWRYKENWGNGSNEHTYNTMSIEEIKSLPVGQICADQCHLYLWVTNPFIKEGIEVCKAWGFEYKTLITWLKLYRSGKPEMGMGYYFRGCTEHLIFGVKGGMKCCNKTTRNFFAAENPRLHSKKPDIARDIIVSASGDVPRIELFARNRIDGWDAWGDQLPCEQHGRMATQLSDDCCEDFCCKEGG